MVNVSLEKLFKERSVIEHELRRTSVLHITATCGVDICKRHTELEYEIQSILAQ